MEKSPLVCIDVHIPLPLVCKMWVLHQHTSVKIECNTLLGATWLKQPNSLVVGGFRVVVWFDDERRADLGGVLSLALIFHIGVETCIVVGSVCHLLESAVWELNSVAA